LRIATVYLILLQRRKWTKEQVQMDSLFIYKPLVKQKSRNVNCFGFFVCL